MSQQPGPSGAEGESAGQPDPQPHGQPDRYGPYGQPPPDQYGPYAGGQDGRPVPPPPGQYGQPSPPGEYGQPSPPGQYGQPPPPGQYGQPPPPGQYGQPPPPGQYGQYGQPPGTGGYFGAGFVPVPTAVQPGIIPLRPLTLGEIYDGAFRAIRSNPMVMFGLAIIVVGAGAVLQVGFTAAVAGRIERAAQAGVADLDAFFGVGAFAGLLLSSAAVSLATLVLEGLAIISVSESVIGRKISLGEVWRRARGRLWRLVALALLMGLAGIVAVVGAVVAIAAVSIAFIETSGESWVALILLIPLMLIVLVGIIAFIGVRIMFATCVIMLEGTGVFASIARSWRMTKGHFWRLLGIMLLTFLLVGILVSILSVPFSMFGSIFAGQGEFLVPLVISSIGQLVGSAISIPVMAAVLALLYIDVRMRSEGLDVELARAAQGG